MSMFLLALSLAHAQTPATKPVVPLEMIERPADVFIPEGFDDNDTVEFVLAGTFPDSKFHTGPLKTRIEGQRVYIDSYVSVDQDVISIPMLKEYQRVVRMDQMAKGTYQIFVKEPVSEKSTDYALRGTLRVTVAQNTSRKDDHDYATVDGVSFDPRAKGQAVIRYSTGSTCLELDPTFKMIPDTRDKQVLVVLPVLRKIDPPSGKDCEPTKEPHDLSIPLLGRSGRILIHVRSGNGESVNKVVDLGA